MPSGDRQRSPMLETETHYDALQQIMTSGSVHFYVHQPVRISSTDGADSFQRDVQNDVRDRVAYSESNSDMEVQIACDGCVSFRLSELEAELGLQTCVGGVDPRPLYLQAANALYFSLEVATFHRGDFRLKHRSLSKEDIVRDAYSNREGAVAEAWSHTSFYLRQRDPVVGRLFASNSASAPMELHVDELRVGAQLFHRISSKSSLVGKFAALAKAWSEFREGHFSSSMILGWTVVELCLHQIYRAHLEGKTYFSDGSTRIPQERLQFLTGRDYTAAIVCNILELEGLISFEDMQTLNAFRTIRNEVTHTLSSPGLNPARCEMALNFATNMILRELGSEFEFARLPQRHASNLL